MRGGARDYARDLNDDSLYVLQGLEEAVRVALAPFASKAQRGVEFIEVALINKMRGKCNSDWKLGLIQVLF